MPYLEKCLKSLSNQDYENIEFILVDDGSTDGSGLLCDEFASIDDRFKVVHKENGGLVSARKTGLHEATGDYIAFVDGDDWIEEEIYGRLMTYINSDDEIDLLEAGYEYWKKDSKELFVPKEGVIYLDRKSREEIIERFFLYWEDNERNIRPTIVTKIYKKSLIEESYNKIPNNLFFGEDNINFCNIISIVKKIKTVNVLLYHYMYYDNSLSHRNTVYSMLGYCAHLYEIYNNQKNAKLIEISKLDELIIKSFIYYVSRSNILKIDDGYKYPNLKNLMNKKIILYGAGKVGQDYYKQFSVYQQCTIVSWVDSNCGDKNMEYATIEPVEKINDYDYDCIVIAVKDQKIAEEIKSSLVRNKVEPDKVIWDYPEKIERSLSDLKLFI